MSANTNMGAAVGGKKKKSRKKTFANKVHSSGDDKTTRKIVKQELRKLGDKAEFPKHVNQTVASLTMPKDYLVPRMGGAMGSDPTALANPWMRLDVSYPVGAKPPEMDLNIYPCFAFRDALRFLIYPCRPSSVGDYLAPFTFPIVMGNEAFPEFREMKFSSGSDVHGDILYPCRIGSSDQHRGWLLSYQDHAVVTVSNASIPVGQYLKVTCKRAIAGQWVICGSQRAMSGSGTTDLDFMANFTGYYAFTFELISTSWIADATPTSGYLRILTGNGQTCWCQRTLPHFSESSDLVEAMRITGVSLMYTNTSPALYRQGQITGLQCPKGTSWLQFTDFGTVSTEKKSVTREITNGAYGFLKPTSTEDLRMRVFQLPGDPNGDDVNQLVWDLYPDSDYLCLVANVNNDQGKQGYLTVAASVEYTTLNQWVEVKHGKLGEPELEQVLELLSSVPQWHENSLHWDDIWGWIKQTASDVWSGIKEIAPIAAAAVPLFL